MQPSIGSFTSNMGFSLLNIAKWLIKKGLKIEYKEISATELQAKAADATEAEQWCWDARYYYTSLDTWKEILSRTRVEQIRYLAEKRDCENIANILHSRISELFELNAFGTVIGAVYQDGNLVGYHGWNAWYCDEGIYFIEPQTDQFAKVEGGRVKLGDWEYEGQLIIWY